MIRSQPLPIKKSAVSDHSEASPSRDGLLSKSLGYASRLPELATLHRRSSEGSRISYCGYLMKRSNKPYRQVSESPLPDIPAPNLDTTGEMNIRNGEHPETASGPQHFADANHETLNNSPLPSAGSEESEELQNSPMERSLRLVANFFGCENSASVVEPTIRQEKLNSLLGIVQHHISSETGNGGSAVVSPDQLMPDENDAKPSTRSTPISINGSPAAPFAPTGPPAPPFYRNDSAPAAFSNLDSSSVASTNPDGQAPMVDFIDPVDGHIWRYKYCILEDGVLYFYRNASDGECYEAQAEREEDSSLAQEDDVSPFGDATDLSKSPMPRTKLLTPFLDRNQRENGAARSNVIWEKRVELDRVGAVRSAEQEYGEYSFELIGVDDEEKADQDVNGSEHGDQDRLILRARNTEEMNEWLFQFHRSLASVVKHIMEAVESSPSSARGLCVPLGDIHHPSFTSGSYMGTEQASFAESGATALSHTLSPAGRFRPTVHLPTSLSHGHGRNRMHRKRSPVQQAMDQHPDTLLSSGYPMPTTGAPPSESFPMSFESSKQPLRKVTPILAKKKSDSAARVSIESGEGKGVAFVPRASSIQQAFGSETKRPPQSVATISKGKYIPPHLRNKKKQIGSSGSRRYIPPQLRQKMDESGSEGKAGDMNGEYHSEIKNEPRFVSLKDREFDSRLPVEGTNDVLDHEVFELSMDEANDAKSSDNRDAPATVQRDPLKLGGCADPMVAVGSILDFPLYKTRKASRVGKVHTDAFGCIGGGPLDESFHSNSLHSDVSQTSDDEALRWEVGAASECGIRGSNEDSYLIASDLMRAFDAFQEASPKDAHSTPVWTQAATHQPGLFAIFDGHCENQAARYAAEKAVSFLLEASTEQYEETLNSVQEIEEILRKAIANLDDAFCRLCTEDGRDWDSGSTALFAVLAHDHLVVANLGDCRGVMCCSVASSEDTAHHTVLRNEGWTELESDDEEAVTDSKWIRATGDGAPDAGNVCLWKEITDVHSPSRNDERRRIREANGWITTEIEIPIGQLQRMDFCDEDVVEILKRCFSDRYHSSQEVTHSKRCSSAPQRILNISRVCGELSVSRAIGDRDFKAAFNEAAQANSTADSRLVNGDAGAPPPDGVSWDCPLSLLYPDNHNRRFVGDLVSAAPEVQKFKVGQKGFSDEFVVLACDGLWDVMDPDDAVRVARGLLFEKNWSAKKAAARLAEIAIHLGSSDNITVIIIRFSKK